MLSWASSDMAGSVNCALKHSIDLRSRQAAQGRPASPAGQCPARARESQNAVAAPTIPPPMTTASAVAGQSPAVGVDLSHMAYPPVRYLLCDALTAKPGTSLLVMSILGVFELHAFPVNLGFASQSVALLTPPGAAEPRGDCVLRACDSGGTSCSARIRRAHSLARRAMSLLPRLASWPSAAGRRPWAATGLPSSSPACDRPQRSRRRAAPVGWRQAPTCDRSPRHRPR